MSADPIRRALLHLRLCHAAGALLEPALPAVQPDSGKIPASHCARRKRTQRDLGDHFGLGLDWPFDFSHTA
jgi:hypothetical protein